MDIEYQIFKPGSLEEIAATFYCPVPMPHIAVGNSLLPVVGDASAIAGYQWLIQHIETYIYSPVDEAHLSRVRVSVYTKERDRAEMLRD